jgi:adenosylmethionine-8-amino-7-oxononanoate aminotransferase
VEASAARGADLRAALTSALADEPWVGEIRGRGLLLGVELVSDRATKAPHPRASRVIERVVAAAKSGGESGLLLYSGSGQANGVDGDQIVLGPPLIINAGEVEQIATGVAAAIRSVRETASIAR